MSAINRARGCIIRIHPAGMRVIMYHDSPGVFVDERGESVTQKVAAAAGYDVQRLAKQKRKQEKLHRLQAELDREFSDQEDAIARAMSSDGKLTVKATGGGQYAIFNNDTRVTTHALNKKEAETLLEQLRDEDEAAPDKASGGWKGLLGVGGEKDGETS